MNSPPLSLVILVGIVGREIELQKSLFFRHTQWGYFRRVGTPCFQIAGRGGLSRDESSSPMISTGKILAIRSARKKRVA
ncbi:hypothetical protein [Aquamicrobium sp. LC103]|uniref:hypothetical protein n=1 Tax=Aquamicrobium sp. LC103 TaxID=1120658 RepID=UPI00109C936F|nr:hypothetical protein [Aquamicrobium sp. LC103]TKT80362.1 hypothetical protein XW59_008470 [Aquamicrobium sp. LC103]